MKRHIFITHLAHLPLIEPKFHRKFFSCVAVTQTNACSGLVDILVASP